MNIILASQSPRRRELMEKLNIPFTVRVADIDEAPDPTLSIREDLMRISRLKAEAIEHGEDDLVIAADTMVVLDGKQLGKPKNRAEAKAMLTCLSGRSHQVMTGLALLQGDKCVTHTEITDVYFRPLTEQEIDAYVASGDCDDKAGAYGIQSGAAPFVEKICGDYYNVVGLPVCRLSLLLKEFMEASL